MKIQLLLLTLLCAGCQMPTGPVVSIVPRVPWPEQEYARLDKKGKNAVSGQAFMKTRGGDVKTCAGETVTLSPVTSYSAQFFNMEVLGKREAHQRLSPDVDSRIHSYLKQTTADASGKFTFYDVPAGDYYLYTLVRWEAPTARGHSQQGGWLGQKVSVRDEERNDFILTK